MYRFVTFTKSELASFPLAGNLDTTLSSLFETCVRPLRVQVAASLHQLSWMMHASAALDKCDRSRMGLHEALASAEVSVPVLNRCIPRPVKDLADQVFSGLYSILNSWDTVEQVLGDLYTAWKEISVLMLVAFVLSLAMIGIIHWLASFVAWIFMLAVTVAAIAGTGILWWTYADMKSSLDKTPDNQLLDESVRNTRAFLAYSIVATIITVYKELGGRHLHKVVL
uniref:Transmembrane protein n=1 Tax=Timema tahoe TaxID=61484 RepID=A0A7R9P191_9NEOP|nr:unnamed protein product [Timema tahoe]